ncbi:MAG: hypothetical protein H0W72_07705 [Planctomycetes bacterium]|nr:hypothetical protein [Planctomycetota bacterium]
MPINPLRSAAATAPLVLLAILGLNPGASAAEQAPAFAQPYVFTDESAAMQVDGPDREVEFRITTIIARGDGPSRHGKTQVRAGRIDLPVLAEGIHRVAIDGGAERRFLGMSPPAALDAAAVRRALPRSGELLLSGKPFTLLSLGDSVTNTGDYEGMLARLLTRAIPGASIRCVDRSYPGRSVDASVREFVNDGPPNHPNLGVIMYGLNDQICNVPLDAYLEQYRWLIQHLASECGADAIVLTPTPHIEIPQDRAAALPDANPPWFPIRTIGYGTALRPLAAELKVPLADGFAAIWGDGGPTFEAASRALWPLFPPGYDRQMESLTETNGNGDTIHPNALGHLRLAQAVFAAIAGVDPIEDLEVEGSSAWDGDGAVTTVRLRNPGGQRLSGKLRAYPAQDAEITQDGDGAYDLAPGAEATITLRWPQARKPEDLLRHPMRRDLSHGNPLISVVDVRGERSRVRAVPAPFTAQARWQRQRLVVTGTSATARLQRAGGVDEITVPLPEGSAVGRIPLLRKVEGAEGSGWAVGELAYARFAEARSGEATIDGDLKEWANRKRWSPLGEPVQARWTRGAEDHRASPDDCSLTWTCLAGPQALDIALRARGTVAADSFTIFLDPRAPDELGSAGRYYWVGGKLAADGRVEVGRGETSKTGDPSGAWRREGDLTTIELRIPYAVMGASAWPAAGDLGLSLHWTHAGTTPPTMLQWFEDGHPWNPRWYGVVRLARDDAPLPFVVRVE